MDAWEQKGGELRWSKVYTPASEHPHDSWQGSLEGGTGVQVRTGRLWTS